MNKMIYIADDEQPIRELMSTFLRSEGFMIKSFSNGDDLLEEFLQNPSDMVILDIMMPGTDGLRLCTLLREKSNVPIIIVSARDSELDRITGITLGSDDYLTKPFSPMELVVRVKAIFRRMVFTTVPPTQSLLTFGDLTIDMNHRSATLKQEAFELTPTELSLMIYLLENQSRAVSREELLKHVWKFDFDADTRATDDVVKRLRKKFSQRNAEIVIQSVWGYGFKLSLGDCHEDH